LVNETLPRHLLGVAVLWNMRADSPKRYILFINSPHTSERRATIILIGNGVVKATIELASMNITLDEAPDVLYNYPDLHHSFHAGPIIGAFNSNLTEC